ncbi:hypothetical protein K440DRAFT_301454 [Wilcoxina mikolae CBS 423.85]|nr:hypothetical protein K440DRAFT_301454 [Wilcoxina mikolae CBS 423.85]
MANVPEGSAAFSSQVLNTHAIAQQVQTSHSQSSTPSEHLLRDLSSAPSGTPALTSPYTKSDTVEIIQSRTSCLNCRQRRIKCDEVHPICEWCQSHSSVCIYPDTQNETVIAPALSEHSCLTCNWRKIECNRALPICGCGHSSILSILTPPFNTL